MEGEILSTKINDYLARYRLFVEQENRANRYNINIRAESFLIPILKCLFDCPNLVNLNLESGKNYPVLDLGDKKKRVAFQVTSTIKSSRVISSLKKFLSDKHKLYEKYDQLTFFFIQDRQKSYKSKEIPALIKEIQKKNKHFQFDVVTDIIDFCFISDKINDYDPGTKQKIHDILMWEVDGDSTSPLSKKPETPRQLIDIPLVGREIEYNRLLNSEEDILIIGQPGIGKTFLLFKLAQDKNAYFVLESNRSDLARAINIINPEILFVDDAHRNPDLLTHLKMIRESVDKPYRIIATCWPTEKMAKVKQAGGFTGNTSIELDLFTQDELADLLRVVIKSFNLTRQFAWEQLIIDQANGFPGIAVALLNMCRDSNGQDVFKGTVLLTHLTDIALETRNELEWHRTKKLLAYFSVGGKKGMAVSDISQATQISEPEIDVLLSTLQYGGIIFFSEWNRIIVRPPKLRAVLLKEEFFSGGDTSRIEALCPHAYSIDLVSTILDAGELGASVPDILLTNLLVENDPYHNQWERYYRIYPERIIDGIKKFPHTLSESAYSGLVHQPSFILPLLFEKASEDKRPLHQHPEHVLRKIQDWLSWDFKTDKTIKKRNYLLDAVIDYFENSGDQKIIVRVLSFIMSPDFEMSRSQPGSGNQATITNGVFSIDVLHKIFRFWPDIFELLGKIDVTYYLEFNDVIHNWAYPTMIVNSIGDELYGLMREYAVKLINNMVDICSEHPALLRAYNKILKDLGKENIVKPNRIFDLLYPEMDHFLDRRYQDEVIVRVRKFAEECKNYTCQEVTKLIKWANQESSFVKNSGHCMIPILCQELAKQVDNQMAWGKTFVKKGLSAEYVSPFFDISVQRNLQGWQEFASELIKDDNYFIRACDTIFLLEEPPEIILSSCLKKLEDGHAEWIKHTYMYNGVSVCVLKKLLTHSNKKIALSSAIGEWLAEPKGQVRSEITAKWQEVIRQTTGKDYFLKEIFAVNPGLAFDWLVNFLFSGPENVGFDRMTLIQETIYVLCPENRKHLVEMFFIKGSSVYEKSKIIRWIVDDDLDIYRHLLEISDERMSGLCLAPLETLPDESNWSDMALLALSKGVSKEDIILASFRKGDGEWFSGPLSNQYLKIRESFSRLKEHENDEIKQIATHGWNMANNKMDSALQQECIIDIYGIDEIQY